MWLLSTCYRYSCRLSMRGVCGKRDPEPALRPRCHQPECHASHREIMALSALRLREMGLMTAKVYTEAGSLADRKIYPLFGSTREEGVDYPGFASVSAGCRAAVPSPFMKHNVYSDGRVQSLALTTEDGPATAGVIT